jgi:hypothetical protein
MWLPQPDPVPDPEMILLSGQFPKAETPLRLALAALL